MVAYIEGKVIAEGNNSLVILAGSVGWRVFIGSNTLAKIQKNKELVKVFTHLYSRENSQDLYGFLSYQELQFFELLLGVSGVGPRHAQLILDNLSPENIVGAVKNNKDEVFLRIPGVGSKLAQKIVIDLQTKVKSLGLEGKVDLKEMSEEDDVIEALLSLGYRRGEAKEALKKITKDVKGLSKKVEEALKILGR